MIRCCAVLAIIVTAAEFIKHFLNTPSVPSTVLVEVARTDESVPRSKPNVLWEMDLKKEEHKRRVRKTAYKC